MKRKDDPPKRKKRKQPGAGMSGSTSRLSKADEYVLGASHSGKIDASTQVKHVAALAAQHKKTGESKSSYIGRTKRKPTVSSTDKTRISVMDTSTGQRVKGKKKLTPEQKAKAKRAKHNATVGKSRAEKKKYRQR